MLCKVHLVPIRGGLLSLPQLKVTADASDGQDNVSYAQWIVQSAGGVLVRRRCGMGKPTAL